MKCFFAHILGLIIVLGMSGDADAFELWNDIRASALQSGDSVTVRTESLHGTGRTNTILYAQDDVQEMPLTLVSDGPSTLEALVPGPVSTRSYYGFRLIDGAKIDLLPVRLAGGATPGRTDLTLVADDPVGDETTGRVNLDLTACRVSWDGTRLFAALSNAGDGFPTSSGLTFFSYLLGIKNPAVADPDTVFALIHTVDVPGIIEPGLYMVYGTGTSDLAKIGEISVTELPAENTLILSCLADDLFSNPVFQSWIDPADPRMDVAGFTQRITLLGGVQDADETGGAIWHVRDVVLDPGPNHMPQLTNLAVTDGNLGGFASVVYSDADGHCPVLAELVFDGDETYPLRPQTLNYGNPVTYLSENDLPPLMSNDWYEAVVRFSDNGRDVVTIAIDNLSPVPEAPDLTLAAAPNPFNPTTRIAYETPSRSNVRLTIHDLSGRHITTLFDGIQDAGLHAATWDGRTSTGRILASGVYLARLDAVGRQVTCKILMTK